MSARASLIPVLFSAEDLFPLCQLMVTCQFGGEFPDALSPIPVGIREARHRETFRDLPLPTVMPQSRQTLAL